MYIHIKYSSSYVVLYVLYIVFLSIAIIIIYILK